MFKQNAFFAAALLATLASTPNASLANTGPLPVNCEHQALADGPLTLQAAAARAVCLHPLSRQAKARLEGAQAQLQGASAALSPQLNASVSMSAADATGAPSVSSTSLVQVRASQVLLDGGLRQAQVEAAELQTRASESDVRAQAQALTLQAARYFYNHQTALSQLKSAEESVRAAQVAHAAAKAKLDAGVAVKVDVLQAQAQLAQAQMELAQAQGAVETSLAALLQHVALPSLPAKGISPQALSCAAPDAVQSPQQLEQALSLARENNPELRASTQRKLASARSSKAAQELDSPSLSWNATMATQKANSSPRAHNASVGLTLEIPLLDGGSNRSRVSQAVALEQQAIAQLDALRLNIELSVRQAASRVSSAAQACEAAEAYVSAANEAAAQAQGRYVSGVGTLPDWLNLQSQQAAARKRLDTALADLALARAELAQATGQLSPNSL